MGAAWSKPVYEVPNVLKIWTNHHMIELVKNRNNVLTDEMHQTIHRLGHHFRHKDTTPQQSLQCAHANSVEWRELPFTNEPPPRPLGIFGDGSQ